METMNAMFSSAGAWDFGAMMKTSGITRDVQQHLAQVYATLSVCVLVAAVSAAGAVMAMGGPFSEWMGLAAFVGTLVGTIWLPMEPVQNHNKRFGILMMVAASMGVSTAALLDMALEMDPSIVVTAFLMTTTVFVCFTGSALLAKRRSYLYLGGILGSALSMMALSSFLNLFFRSTLLFSAHLYLGLFMFCGYVVFDTQMIIEKASLGDKDSLRHALELFLDFVSIFVRILVILMKNSDKKKDRSETNNNNRRR